MTTLLLVPALGESIIEAVIAKWLKQVGDVVTAGEAVAELETDKVTVDLPAPVAGLLSEQHHPAGATVRVGDSIGLLSDPADAAPPTPVTPSRDDDAPAPRQRPLTPAMRRAARERALDLPPPAAPPDTDASPAPPPPAPSPPSPPAPPPSRSRALPEPVATDEPEQIVTMSPLRRRIAERLVEAQHSAAILTTFNEVDMSAVIALRTRFQEPFQARHGIKLGFMSFFARASVETLREFPGLNAELRGNEIVYKQRYHFGIAVSAPRGLVVPVLRDVDRLSFAAIEHGIVELSTKARNHRLALADLQGGTFSITNGGTFGSLLSTPLLNLPQTAILAMHNIVSRPVAVGDQIALRPMMYVALSYDHRVVDGREAVLFLVGVKARIEAPERLLFDL